VGYRAVLDAVAKRKIPSPCRESNAMSIDGSGSQSRSLPNANELDAYS